MNATLNPPQTQRTTLYYREGSSDKVYQASVEPQAEGFIVNFAYGRRGSTMNTGTKTQEPVDYETATRIFTKLVNEKRAKGYTEGPAGTPYQNTAKEDRVTSILPQLLNPIDEPEAKRLLLDPQWAMQEKLDGRRVLVRKVGAEIHGINRKGLLIGLPETVFQSVKALPGTFVMDGECIGDRFYAFDLLEWNGEDYRAKPYQRRFIKIANLLDQPDIQHIKFAEITTDPANKERMFRHLQAEKKEGVVFKRLDAPYTPGRPNSGGNQLKHKFYATCSAVVAKINDQRSVELRLLNGQGWIPVGNVTIPANQAVPKVGDILEVRYLYSFRESNALYQPTSLGQRDDLQPHECVLSQLKYKSSEDDEPNP
jgi:bifunctional non-homologous end joining protein LigD